MSKSNVHVVEGIQVPAELMEVVRVYTDSLLEVQRGVAELPADFRSTFLKHFDVEGCTEDFSNLISGLADLRAGRLPSSDSLFSLQFPWSALTNHAWGMRGAAAAELHRNDSVQRTKVVAICMQMESAAASMAWEQGSSRVDLWLERTNRALYDEESTPPIYSL